nr:hypothetical protein [uncultured bacterium]
MPQNWTRKIAVTGALSAIAIVLGITGWGLLPWFSGTSVTIMHIPAIIGAILEGPIVGGAIGLIFGIYSMIQAAVAPAGAGDVIFTNPLISVLPRILFAPAAWLVWRSLKRWPVAGMIATGAVGSLLHSVLVLGTIGLLGLFPWALIGATFVANSLPEMAVSTVLVTAVTAAWKGITVGKKKGADL